MNYARDYFSTWGFYRKKQEQEHAIESSRFDAYFNFVYKVLLWDDPILTWTTLGAIHVLFWIVVHFEVRLYGFIFSMILFAFVLDTYFDKVGLQERRTVETDAVRKVGAFITEMVLYLKTLREDNPSVFCGTMCAMFLAISILARNVSGYFLTYLGILLTFFMPHGITKLPAEYLNCFKRVMHDISNKEDLVAESELIPFLKEYLDKDVDQDSIVTDKTADSVTSSLITGLTSMPSHLDGEGSLDGLEEEDLLPKSTNRKTHRHSGSDSSDSSGSSSESRKHMSFSLTHFNHHHQQQPPNDMSSDDEDEFERKYTSGMSFTMAGDSLDGATSQHQQQELTSAINPMTATVLRTLEAMMPTVATNLAGNLFSSVIGNTAAAAVDVTFKRQDSDSDFEIINSEEADDETT